MRPHSTHINLPQHVVRGRCYHQTHTFSSNSSIFHQIQTPKESSFWDVNNGSPWILVINIRSRDAKEVALTLSFSPVHRSTTNKCHPGLDLQNGWPFHSTDVVHTGSQGLDDVKNITSDPSILWMQKTLLDPSILLVHRQVGPWKCTQGASYPWNAASHKWQVET